MKRIALVCGMVTACGGGGSSSGPIAIGDLGSKFVSAYCDLTLRCHQAPDRATCETEGALYFDVTALTDDVNAGAVQYDADAAGRCVGDLAALACDDETDPVEDAQYDKDCAAAFTGALAAGAACANGAECASGSCEITITGCDALHECCPGMCNPAFTPAAEGADCSSTDYECASASDACSYDDATQTSTCQPRGAEGAACEYGTCVEGLACVADASGNNPKCAKPAATGAACTDPNGCESGFCDASSGTCADRIAVGAACDPSAYGCVPWATCDASSSTCVAKLLPGAACTSSTTCLVAICDTTTNTCPSSFPVCTAP